MADKRRLAAVMFSDICGYTRLMGDDEAKALRVLDANRTIHQTQISAHGGHFVKEIGDGNLVWFDSALKAVECALAILREAKEVGYVLRFGIHEGDTIIQDTDIFGSGVNIASRIEVAAAPGSIMLSEIVVDSLKNQRQLPTKYIGTFTLKSDHRPRKLYALADTICVVPGVGDIRATPSQVSIANRRSLVIVAIAILLMVALWLGLQEKQVADTRASDEEIILAIMPFKSSNDNAEVSPEALAAGLTDKMTLVPGVVTIAPNETKNYGSHIEEASMLSAPNEVASQMNATHFVEGTIDGDLSITLRLTGGDSPVWTRKYSLKSPRSAVNVVVSEIVQELGLTNSSSGQHSERSFDKEASTLYLEALSLWYERSSEQNLVQAIQLLEEADKLEPNYPDVLGLLALCWATGTELNYFDFDTSQHFIFDYAERTLNLDNVHEHGLLALGTYYFILKNYSLAHTYYSHAFDRAPDKGITSQALGELALYTGRYAESLEHIKRAHKASPFDMSVRKHLAYTEMANGFPKASKKICDEIHEDFGVLADSVHYKAIDHIINKEFAAAVEILHDNIGQKRTGMSYLLEGFAYTEQRDTQRYMEYMAIVDTASYPGQHIHIMWLAHNEGEAGAQRAGEMYKLMMEENRFSLTFPIQTYPFECFNSFRTNSSIQREARAYQIEFSEHPYFKMRSEFESK